MVSFFRVPEAGLETDGLSWREGLVWVEDQHWSGALRQAGAEEIAEEVYWAETGTGTEERPDAVGAELARLEADARGRLGALERQEVEARERLAELERQERAARTRRVAVEDDSGEGHSASHSIAGVGRYAATHPRQARGLRQ